MRVMHETLTLLPSISVSAFKRNKYKYIMKKYTLLPLIHVSPFKQYKNIKEIT